MKNLELFEQKYKRNQMEQGVWRALTYWQDERSFAPMLPTSITIKIKKLLELDAQSKADGAEDHAFFMQSSSGLGNERKFSLMDCFCIAVSLQFFDLGFKQSHIVFLLQHLRLDLEEVFYKLSLYPMPLRIVQSTKKYPELPRFTKNDIEYVDSNVFLVFNRVELPDMYGYKVDNQDTPLAMNHKFYFGVNELQEHFKRITIAHLNTVCLELARLAKCVQHFVPLVEPAKRGRKAQAVQND